MGELYPFLLADISKLGGGDVTQCYSCGVCTAICPLSEEGGEFPRRLIRYAMLGMEDELLGSPLLWACYYCGECTRSCPRQADPGGFMHAARKYAIIKNSLGGIASIFHDKFRGTLAYLALSIIFLLGAYFFRGKLVREEVQLFTLFPRNLIHDAGIVLGIYILVIAIVQVLGFYRRTRLVYLKDVHVSPMDWLKSFTRVLINETLWQSRYTLCENKNRFIAHMAIFWGFLLLFAATGSDFIAGYRTTLGTILGYMGGALLVGGSFYFLSERLSKSEEYVENSDFSDWSFLLLVLLAGITGFLLDPLKAAGKATAYYAAFLAHMTVVFNLIVTAPFTKFGHLVYRPLALMFIESKKTAAAST